MLRNALSLVFNLFLFGLLLIPAVPLILVLFIVLLGVVF